MYIDVTEKKILLNKACSTTWLLKIRVFKLKLKIIEKVSLKI